MNALQGMQWQWTSPALICAMIAVCCTAICSGWIWRQSGYRWSIGALELLRLLIVLLIGLLLNQPEWIESFRNQEKSTLVVLWDGSKSMETRDVVGTAQERQSRQEAIRKLIDPQMWQGFPKETEVLIESFSSKTLGGGGTDLATPLAEVAEKQRNLKAVVLISDGDWNKGLAPIEGVQRLRQRGIPVFSIPVGSRSRLPDLELLSMDLPTVGTAGKSVRVPFTIENTLPREVRTTVVFKVSDGSELSQEVVVPAMGRETSALVWKPTTMGDFTAKLQVPVHPDERVHENNSLTAPITIRQEKLKVLIVESVPRWEYRYLRNALSRDPGIDVGCLLFHPGLSKMGGGTQDYLKRFPEHLDELSKYDVVFLGDVGTTDDQLTPEQCRLLKGLVERQASGLVFMPGWQGRQFSLLETELGDLCPVQMDESQPRGWGTRTPGHFELTDAGRRSLLTKLADTQDENLETWEKLPGFQWYAPVVRAKAGTEVLCVHQGVTNEFGHLPLLVTRTYGTGKVLFMGTDGAWRWRKGVEDKYHYRFWGQVVRWMAYQRNMAKGESLRLFYTPEQPQAGQSLTLQAHVMSAAGEPLQSGDVSIRITAPSGKGETIKLTSAGDEWGVFTGTVGMKEAGKHEAVLYCSQTQGTLTTNIFVQGGVVERIGRPARPEVLEELSRMTQGQVLSSQAPAEVVEQMRGLPQPTPEIRRIPLWSHPLTAGLVIVLLGGFWTFRKVVGML